MMISALAPMMDVIHLWTRQSVASMLAQTPPAAPDPAVVQAEIERSLVFLGDQPLWLSLGLWAMAALVIGLTVYNHRKLLPMRRRVGMIALRTLVVAMLVMIFYQPAFLEEKVARNRNVVAVLVDQSESMQLPHSESTRSALATDFLQRHQQWLQALGEEHRLVFYGFDAGLSDLPDLAQGDALSDPSTLTFTGSETLVVDALDALRQRHRNDDVGGVLLLTDGIDTSTEGHRAQLSRRAERLLSELDAPIYAVTSAGDPSIKDLAVTHVAYNNFAFLLNATSLEAVIEVHGYQPESTASPVSRPLVVRLTENGQLVSETLLALEPGRTDYRVKFDFVPRTLGKQVFGVEIDPLPDEILAKNNRRQVIINVVRDKIRVVQIVGQPSWDERFLRDHLKENPNVDLVSFFILVNRFNLRPLSSRDTSLIPFPARELFEEELGGFDLLIFQNFNYGPFQTRQYLPNIAKYVREGGAFVMVGGPLSLSAGGYYGTPITDVLPVEIPPGFGDNRTTDEAEFRPHLTESGQFHPITRLALDPAANRRVWSEIAPLEGVNLISRIRDDSVVLLEHPVQKARDGEALPLVSVREVDKGRSMVVASDSLWHWAFKAGDEGQDPHHYDAFWSNAIRWLIKDPELDLVRTKVLRESVVVGESAVAQVQVFRADYRPAAGQRVDIVVRRRAPGDGRGQGEVVLRKDALKADADGALRIEVPVESAGVYEVEAKAQVVEGRTASGIDLFVGTETKAELDRVVGNDRLLVNLAKASGGAVLPFDGDTGSVVFEPAEVIRVKSRHHEELWSSIWVLLIIAALLGTEWWLRRRYGYL